MENLDPKKITERIIENQKRTKKNVVYSIDWLTLNLKLSDPSNISILIENIYKVRRGRGTHIFQHVDDYYNKKDELLFTIVSNPYSSIIKENFAQLQIANKWLYVGNLEKLIYKIFFHSNFEFDVISRIDISADFYNFEEYDEKNKCYYSPVEFIKDFQLQKVTKTNPSKFVLWGKTGNYENICHCLNIGDSKSVFNWKLYNKSKEIKETNGKTYIVRKWERDLLHYEKEKDVWRLEISIKSLNKVKIMKNKKEINLNLKNWLENYPYYFLYFLSKKFVFKNELGKFIDFFKLPAQNSIALEVSTNLPHKDDFSPTYKEKENIVRALVNIIGKADNEFTALEYIEKLEDLLEENDYFEILKSRGINIDVLNNFYASKFNKYPLFTENMANF